ncbi:putative O-glycosylation ligase, exosortase A system-associated [Sphingobium subterraneum]|uniref:Putative O-glycosylation ligase (Exosortase A-associated) n=1 Tax=Sphingobium subterraneum TaxID=627688 RepID=A0A841IY58_9SPHN|nr:putative O-glycosylation ligase, exosortase A system-associated [Sphingobium subterraneum]MBB6123334.1 putative O-glycosylation ligase (exosortase A-associated) [Sphingobium subterraneum]
MRDLFLVAFLAAYFALAFKRPFLFFLVYTYIDIVSPQRLSYFLLNSVPISAIAFGLAFLGWAFIDDKRDSRISVRQILILALLVWCGYTTSHADFPVEAASKWSWVWKSLVFAVFLPLTLRTRLRIEALALTMILSASSIIVTGGIKTALSGGGYGSLNLMVDNNSGLYEGSIISTVAIAIIPLIVWLARHGTIIRPSRLVTLYAGALIFACLLIPVGTEARTGLLCIGMLGGLLWLHAKRRMLYGSLVALAALAAIPLLPSNFTNRMNTIQNYQGDQSASTRLQVWKWTWDYAKVHPGGGGFDAYRSNSFTYDTVQKDGAPGSERLTRVRITEKSRAYHNSYFEVLGEQGYLGFALWITVHILSLGSIFRLYRSMRTTTNERERWVAPLALALLQGHLICLLGSMFVGIAYQPFIFMMLALEIGLSTYMRRKKREAATLPIFAPHTATLPRT